MERIGFWTVVLATTLVAQRAQGSDEEPSSAEEPSSDEAQEPQEDEETRLAREHFVRGAAFVKAAQWPEALDAFEQSAKLKPHAVTRYNIGACLRAMGRYLEARTQFQHALRGQQELSETLVREARAFLDEIERVIVRLSITLEPAGAAIAIDGRPLELHRRGKRPVMLAGTLSPGAGRKAPARSFDVLVDPGAHVILLSRKGFSNAVVNETLHPGEKRRLVLKIDKLPATMLIDANRARSIVTVDGRDVGMTPVRLARPGGSYKVVVEKDGFVGYETIADVDPGEMWRVRAELPERTAAIYERWWFWGSIGAVVTTTALVTYFLARPEPTRPDPNGGGLNWVVETP
jgi:hypothetical protein